MKTLFKITALAAVAAFVVISCAPAPELTGVNWDDVNTKNDPNKNTPFPGYPEGFGLDGALSAGENAPNVITLTFPEESDFLKAGKTNIETKLGEFLSFHHFTKTADPVARKADSLGSPLEYIFVRRNVNDITVKLTKTFEETDSNVIVRINGTKYTYAGGNKMDLVGAGIRGEADYDDLYMEIELKDATGPSGFFGPRWVWDSSQNLYLGLGLNRGWNLELIPINTIPAEEGVLSDFNVAYLDINLNGLAGDDAAITAIATAVADQLKTGLKIQKYVNRSWSNVSAQPTFTYDPETGFIIGNTLTLEDLVPYRVMWEGRAPVITTLDYFGVKQYIAIVGDNTTDEYSRPSYPECYRTGKVYGPGDVWYDPDETGVNVSPTNLRIHSSDFLNQNVVIDVLFNNGRGILDGSTTHWLKDFNHDKKKFRDNFKIAYYSGTGGSVNDFTSRSDVVYINIKDFEMLSFNPNNGAGIGFNAVRITLDPAYKWDNAKNKYFYISPEIGYDDGKTTFGDPDNFLHNLFKVYPAPAPAAFLQSAAPPALLTAGVWAEGNLSRNNSVNWYSFPVTEDETYYIWVNDRYDGRIPQDKTGDVVISARYAEDTVIFGGTTNYATSVDGNWNIPQAFTADRTGIVEVRVIPYNGIYGNDYVGTYGIVYDTDDTRPGASGWTAPTNATPLAVGVWADGNSVTPYREQWFTFTATADTQYIHTTVGTLSNLYVQLYNSAGETVGTESYAAVVQRPVTQGQTYYIRVWPMYRPGRGTYQIAFNAANTPPPVTPPANAIPLTLNVWKDGYIATAEGEQWFTFTATANIHYIYANFDSLTNLNVQLYDSTGEPVNTQVTLSGTSPSVQRTVASGQVYYIRVRPNGGSGNYQIGYTAINFPPGMVWPPDPCSTLTGDTWSVDGNLTAANREQWFKFTATSASHWIHFEPVSGSMDSVVVQFYNDLGGAVGPTNVVMSTADSSKQGTGLPTTGVTYIRVRQYTGTGNYRIKFNTSPLPVWPPSCPTISAGTWTPGSNTATEVKWYTVTDDGINRYLHGGYFTEDLTYTGLYVEIYNASGGLVDDTGFVGNTNVATMSGTTAGQTYYLKVRADGIQTGSFNLTLGSSTTRPSVGPFNPTSNPDIAFDTFVDGELTSLSDENWFSFTSTQTGELSIEFSANGTLANANVVVYDSYHSLAFAGDWWRSDGYPEGYPLSFTVNSGVKYYIGVFPGTYMGDPIGTYEIRVSQ
jgi:hypothetical protein